MAQTLQKTLRNVGVETMRFASDGVFLPIPLAYPGVNRPIPPDSSYLRRIMVVPGRRRERIFGLTSGERSHCFMALPKPPHGYVVDMGAAPEGVALIDLIDLVRIQPDGYRAMALLLLAAQGKDSILYAQGRPHATPGLQEWKVFIPPRREISRLPGFGAHSCLLDPEDSQRLLVAGPKRWAVLSLAEDNLGTIEREATIGTDLLPVAKKADGGDLWMDQRGLIFAWDWTRNNFRPCGEAPPTDHGLWQWARTDGKDGLWLSNGTSHLYQWNAEKGLRQVGQAPYAPVHFLVPTPDGRCFGFCGEGIGHWFEWVEEEETVRRHGPIASFLVNPRYGFHFTDAAAGQDGALYLAENDRGGHLWIHYPGLRESPE